MIHHNDNLACFYCCESYVTAINLNLQLYDYTHYVTVS